MSKCNECEFCILKDGNYFCKDDNDFLSKEIMQDDSCCQAFVRKKSFEDVVNHPSHYTSGKVECIDCIESAMTSEQFEGFLKGNVMKYVFRCGKKDEAIQELKKAEWYLNRLIQFKEGQK